MPRLSLMSGRQACYGKTMAGVNREICGFYMTKISLLWKDVVTDIITTI